MEKKRYLFIFPLIVFHFPPIYNYVTGFLECFRLFKTFETKLENVINAKEENEFFLSEILCREEDNHCTGITLDFPKN